MIEILLSSNDETIIYAAKELKKYLNIVTDTMDYAVIKNIDKVSDAFKKNTISLGLLSDFGLDDSGVLDSELDDLVDVNIINGTGYIAGSNPRSILFGVYDYFKSKGCAWVRPGINGEHIVKFDPKNHSFTYRKLADTRFRGECLEGGVKYEHVLATIEWAPKVHMNLFMIQFMVPYVFMSYWYTHHANTKIPSEELSYDAIAALTELIEKDARRCGLQLHDLGHGYQFMPYGVNPIDFNGKYNLTEEAKNALALVNGERKFLFGGVPLYSQLCMGNEKVLEDQVKWLADYAQSKPQINFLHIWLGDAYNNHCECPLCTPHHPSDLYVKMLNMLDKELTRRNLDTRIVFISYVDTLWAPLKERIDNEKRFIMCTAISGRDYNKPYDDSEYDGEIPVWVRNKYNVSNDFALRRKMFQEWKKVFDGPNFVFEYHFYTMHFNDPSTLKVAKNYYEDLHQLKPLGFGGMMNCQTQRIAFPSAFHIALCGEAQFDLSRTYDELEEEYYKNCFGENWKIVYDYLTEISEALDPAIISDTVAIDFVDKILKPSWYENELLAIKLKSVPDIVNKYMPIFAEYQSVQDVAISRSFKLLNYHGEYCKRLSNFIYYGAIGDMVQLEKEYSDIIDWLSSIEMEIQYEFDLRLFVRGFNGKINILKKWIDSNK